MRRCAVLAILMDLSPFRLLCSERLASYPLATLSGSSGVKFEAPTKKPSFDGFFALLQRTLQNGGRYLLWENAARAICLIA
jgi:hypothetical protein